MPPALFRRAAAPLAAFRVSLLRAALGGRRSDGPRALQLAPLLGSELLLRFYGRRFLGLLRGLPGRSLRRRGLLGWGLVLSRLGSLRLLGSLLLSFLGGLRLLGGLLGPLPAVLCLFVLLSHLRSSPSA
jgi:hypothetical protein